MTKKELINVLNDIPDDAEVLVPSNETPRYISPAWAVLFDSDTNEKKHRRISPAVYVQMDFMY